MARNSKKRRMTSAGVISPTPMRSLSPMLRATVPRPLVGDLRFYQPDEVSYDIPRTTVGTHARTTIRDRDHIDRFGNAVRKRSHGKGVLAFAAPSRVVHCIRRKERREVLFASGKGGMPTWRMRQRRLNRFSKLSCKR